MKWLQRAGMLAAVWSTLALLETFQRICFAQNTGETKSLLLLAGIPFIFHTFWALVTVPIILYVRALQRHRIAMPIKAAAHVAAIVAMFVLSILWWIPFQPIFHSPVNRAQILNIASTQIYSSVWYYLVIAGATLGVLYYQNFLAAQVRESEYRATLAEAQLRALKLQLQPHFLFNTLHSASALLRDNPDAADDVLADLGALLRLSLDSPSTHEVTVDEELKALELYLRIQQVRFQEWLTLRLTVDPQTHDAMMPHLLLQPLVENAIRHGIARRATPGTLAVEIKRHKSSLRLTVSDDGPGCNDPAGVRDGIGLSNAKARMETLYGKECSFDIQNSPAGFAVVIEIPFRISAKEAAC
jgi:signal transduction histidine kinase